MVKVILIVVGALETVSEGLEKLEICERSFRSFRSQQYGDLPEYSEESWRPKLTCCHSDSSERSLVFAGVKKSLIVK